MLVKAAALLAFVCVVNGQTQESNPPVIRSNTRLVQLNVVVREKSGPVPDLKQEDFAITDNGKPQKVSIFQVKSSRSVIAGEAPSLPENVFSNTLTRHAETPASLTVILLDGLNTAIEDQQYARQQLEKFLGTLTPQDRIAIYTLGSRLVALHDFTSDRQTLLEILRPQKGSVVRGTPVSETIVNLLRNEAGYEQTIRTERTYAALESIANHIAPLPGRKNLVWIAGDVPMFASAGLLRALDVGDYRAGTWLFRAARALADGNVALYPTDARGLLIKPIPRIQARRVGNMGVTENTRSFGEFADADKNFQKDGELPMRDKMRGLAMVTGGRAFFDTNDVGESVRKAIDDAEVTYTLGFYPDTSELDGKFHQIKVTVPNRKGLDVRARKGYFAKEPTPPTPEQIASLASATAESPLEAFGISLAARVDRKDDALGIALIVPTTELALQEKNGVRMGAVDFVVAQVDKSGRILSKASDTLQMALKPETYQKMMTNGIPLRKLVKLEAGAEELRIVLVDRTTLTAGSVVVPVNAVHATAK